MDLDSDTSDKEEAPQEEEEEEEDEFSDMSFEELRRSNEMLFQQLEGLETENYMFEAYLRRIEPQTYRSVLEEEEEELKKQAAGQSAFGQFNKQRRSQEYLKLTAEHKCDIATRELEEIRDEIEGLRDESERVIDGLKAIMEEADIRLVELKKASYEFRRDIVQGALNGRTGKIMAERVVRYFEEKIRAKDTLIEKLRLKNSTLKVQKNKLYLQLKQKEEMGEVLLAIDFDQLKIENKQYIEKIEERNQDLLKLKLTSGNTLQVLNSYKKRLNNLTIESQKLKSEIRQRNDLGEKIEAETGIVEVEQLKAQRINNKLKRQLDNYVVPGVLDYVKEKAEQYELVKKVKSWERKVEIADMALRQQAKIWRQICSENHSANPWNAVDPSMIAQNN
eukprot:Nk52_evm1s106 gene=Nk52_evmTU1s106